MPISSSPIEKGSSFDNKNNINNKKGIDFLLEEPIYSYDDMVLSESLKNAIDDATSIYRYRSKLFEEWNLGKVIKKPTNVCINFFGEPGTGKTMAAHAVAKSMGMKIINVNYADIESKYVGETSKNLSRLFSEAEEKNAIILFDEADALLSRRVTDMSSATDVSVNQTRSVLLTLLDSFSGIVLFTTNFISNYDPAFMRRIPNHIEFPLPNEDTRIHLLEHYLNGIVPHSIDITMLAKQYDGITGSDISNALINSALKTVRSGKETVCQLDFEEALNNIISAKRANRKSRVTVTEREVSEEYALNQLKKNGDNNI